jgi:sarcosine reductase
LYPRSNRKPHKREYLDYIIREVNILRLELGNIFIKDVQFGDVTKVEKGTLYVNKTELLEAVSGDPRLTKIEIDIAKPGEETRIMPVKDVIEPRVKVEGPGGIFPGMISKVDVVGSGKTNALKGVAVVTAGKIVGFQEGIIDMSGPGAKYTPFSKTQNIVIVCTPVENLQQHEHEQAVRMVGLKAAAYIGEAGKNITSDEVKVYETPTLMKGMEQYPNLPRVAYVYMLQTQGLLHDTYVYGVDAKKIVPTLIYPTEVMDGAIVSGNCVSACDKNPTYNHLNNPIIEDLYERHGKDFNFVGVIITNENVTLADKERSSNWTAKLAEYLNLDAVIISEEGFGNPDTDLMMNCKKISAKGIKTVLVTDEYAGRDGASQSLADADKSADAVVTAGNANEIISLPPMKKVIGYLEPADIIAGGFSGSLKEDGSIVAELQVITGSTSEIGFNTLSAAEY